MKVCIEAVVRMCSVKKVFLEISHDSQENTCVSDSFLIKLQARPATLLKKSLWHMCFPVNFPKSLRTPFFTEHLRWLLLYAFHRGLIVKEKRLLSLSYSLMRIRCRCYPFKLNYFSKSNKSKTTMKHN